MCSACAAASAAPSSDVHVRPFEPQDLPTVIELLRAGMLAYEVHQSQHSAYFEDYVQESAQGDLADIQANYMAKGGNFWVATVPHKSDSSQRVVAGMVALELKGDGVGELRRMSVNSNYRRLGLGRLLLSHLEQWARAQDFKMVFLTTGVVMDKARQFYSAHGYVEMEQFLFSEEPRLEGLRFEKQLREL